MSYSNLPTITVSPAHNFGRPTLDGQPTETLAEQYLTGGEHEVQKNHNISRHELLVALWYEGEHGCARHRRRWRQWARNAAIMLWAPANYDINTIELPPRERP